MDEVILKNRVLAKTRRSARITPMTLRTGEHCSITGWWGLETDPRTKRFISKGSIMPAHAGMTTFWVLSPAARLSSWCGHPHV